MAAVPYLEPPPTAMLAAGAQSPPRQRCTSPWTCSMLTAACTTFAVIVLAIIGYSFTSRQFDDPKGCRMSYMRATFVPFDDFTLEHSRFASKYSLYLYREGGIDEDPKVKGIPVLFIPGNAGSYKQVRTIAAEAANQYHHLVQHAPDARDAGKRPLDFFTVDFNEDITAFHGQTLLEQADYLNDAIAFILTLYTDPVRSLRDTDLPDPTSVILVGHSMGGVVARTMLTRDKYMANSINTIITLSAPHIRPPISFDSDMVSLYTRVNNYWKRSYAEQWASNNPLWHVTLISIAGGGLDTVVPSDYASLNSLVPDTHGFTVFSSTIPHVWTGMDHLAILWCDQLRKALVRALYDVVNVNRPSQTNPRAERMRIFRKRFLTGMESGAEKSLGAQEPTMLLTLDGPRSSAILPSDKRLVLPSLGPSGDSQVHLMAVPPQDPTTQDKQFTLLTDQQLGPSGTLDVLFCSIQASHHASGPQSFESTVDLSHGRPGSINFACKSAAIDTVALPSSTNVTRGFSDEYPPFSHLNYRLADLADYRFVAIVDLASEPSPGWVIAGFSNAKDSTLTIDEPLQTILLQGVRETLPASRPLVANIHIPAIHSSLLSYRLDIEQECYSKDPLFLPLVRQYTTNPYESRYFVNPTSLFINLHSTSPYLPPPSINTPDGGLSLQIWTDPACQGPMQVSLRLDLLGSAGQLYMRYRTAFAAFPLLIIALILRKQFTVYNATGIFITFADAMDKCIRTSLPLIFLALTCLAISLTSPGGLWMRTESLETSSKGFGALGHAHGNDLLLGFHDRFFWFLVPLFGIVSVGVCVAANYLTLVLTTCLTAAGRVLLALCKPLGNSGASSSDDQVTSPAKRLATTGILLVLVATIIPYQFAYVVLCIVQLATCMHAQGMTRGTESTYATNFHAFTHSILVLMLWVLPINLPVLIVWVHNLAVHWLTPFSSHHNIMSILPFILLIETLSTGRMVPQMAVARASTLQQSPLSRYRVLGMGYFTNIFLFGIACTAALYGVTYAYLLHYLVNALCAWLLALYLCGDEAAARHGPSDDAMEEKSDGAGNEEPGETTAKHNMTAEDKSLASDEGEAVKSRAQTWADQSLDPLVEHRRSARVKRTP